MRRASIYLCGFMGCGKTFMGRRISELLAVPFVDLDSFIVENEGMTIPEIFDKFGEQHFRALEASYIRKLSGGNIVATGGGAIINPQTAEFARKSGAVIFINTDFETCYARIQGDQNRPLVMNSTKAQLKELYNKRKPIYKAQSTYTVNGNGRTEIISEEIIRLANYWQRYENGNI